MQTLSYRIVYCAGFLGYVTGTQATVTSYLASDVVRTISTLLQIWRPLTSSCLLLLTRVIKKWRLQLATTMVVSTRVRTCGLLPKDCTWPICTVAVYNTLAVVLSTCAEKCRQCIVDQANQVKQLLTCSLDGVVPTCMLRETFEGLICNLNVCSSWLRHQGSLAYFLLRIVALYAIS